MSVLAIGVDIEQLSFEIQVIDLCHIARLSVRTVDRLLDARIISKTTRPQLRQLLSDIRDLERLSPIAVRVYVVNDGFVRIHLCHDTFILDVDRDPLHDVIEEVFDILLVHANAAVRCVAADGGRHIRPMDPIITADPDPAIAERTVRPRRHLGLRIIRIDPGRIDLHFDHLAPPDRCRRIRLARCDRIHADADVPLIQGEKAARQIDLDPLVLESRSLQRIFRFPLPRFRLSKELGARIVLRLGNQRHGTGGAERHGHEYFFQQRNPTFALISLYYNMFSRGFKICPQAMRKRCPRIVTSRGDERGMGILFHAFPLGEGGGQRPGWTAPKGQNSAERSADIGDIGDSR